MTAQRTRESTHVKPLDAVFLVIPTGLTVAYWLASFPL